MNEPTKMRRWRLVALMGILFRTLYPRTGKTTTVQDLINEACAPTHYPLLPPCGKEITLDELKSRLHYKLEMVKAENALNKYCLVVVEKITGFSLLKYYANGWDSLKKMALSLSTGLVREQVSKAIDAEGVAFLVNTNGDPDLVRRNILWHFIMNGWDKERIDLLKTLYSKTDPNLLFHVEPPHR
jgi:hypothetical protein